MEMCYKYFGCDKHDCIMYGIYTGLRPQELRLLQKEQVVKSASGDYSIFIEHHKTSASSRTPRPRSVPMTPETVEIYQRQCKNHPKSPYVFHDRNGTPYLPRIYSQKFKRKCQRVKIPIKPPYALRHTHANMQAGLGISESVGRSLMGHTKSETYARYTKNTQPYHKDAIALVANHLNGFVKKAESMVTTQTDRVSDRVGNIHQEVKRSAVVNA